MIFELVPILDNMIDLYQKPVTLDRFKVYLKLLHGNTKSDLLLPISGFNPMAKEHVLAKLLQLKELQAEDIIRESLTNLNKKITINKDIKVKVIFNLSDDLKGGWTNYCTSDYDSKFKINALINRNFCVPIFWTSESFNPQIIEVRTLEYCYRTIYWLDHPKPNTLKDHILQERFVANAVDRNMETDIDFQVLYNFFTRFQATTEYPTILNFLYGDEHIAAIGHNKAGIKEALAGYKFANYLANQKIN